MITDSISLFKLKVEEYYQLKVKLISKVDEDVSHIMVDSRQQNISREQLGQFVRSKKHFYNAMLQMGYVMPAFKQSIISIKFMHQVRIGSVFMPKAEDVDACRMVAYPPTNEMILAHVKQAAENLNGKGDWNMETLQPVKALVEEV